MCTQTHVCAEPPRWGTACPDHNLWAPVGPRQHPQTLSSWPRGQRRGRPNHAAPPCPPKGGLQEGGRGKCGWRGRCPGSLRRGATGPRDRQMGRKCGPASGLSGGGRRSQPHPKANSPSLGVRPAPTCASPRPAASPETPAGSQAGGPAPHTPGGFGRQHGWASSIFSLGNTSPVVPPGQGIPTLCRGKLRPAWGPGGPCRAWGRGAAQGGSPSAPGRPSSRPRPLPRAPPPGSPNLAPPQSHGAGRFGAQAGFEGWVEAAGWAGSHPGRGRSTALVGRGGVAPPPLPPPPHALQLLGCCFSC